MSTPTTPFMYSLVAVAFAFVTEAGAGPITVYTIDPNRSYVRAYVPGEWITGASAQGAANGPAGNAPRRPGGELGTGGAVGGTGGGVGNNSGNVAWSRDWTMAYFKLSGSFSIEAILSDWVPTRSRLYFREQAIVTDVPAYAGFGLPYFLAKHDDQVSHSSDSCFDFDFYLDPSMTWSCSGWPNGSQSDQGTLRNGFLVVDGGADSRVVPHRRH